MQSLTQKEKTLLQDQAKHEEICIQKYSRYAGQVKDPELRNLFNEYAKEEQDHLSIIQGFLGQSGANQNAGNQVSGQFATRQSMGMQPIGGQQSQEVSGEFPGPGLSGGNQGGPLGNRAIFGGQAPGSQPSNFAQTDFGDSVYRAPQNMEGRETMRQLGWANRGARQEIGQMGSGSSAGQGFSGSGAADEASMCTDMLMTEKYMSGAYDTSIFESSHPELRKALQRIQEDEQKHGEGIFNYMKQKGLYNTTQS